MQAQLAETHTRDTAEGSHWLHTRGIRLLGRKILGLKCERPDIDLGNGMKLYIPSQPTGLDRSNGDQPGNWRHAKEVTCWAKVVRFGPRCKFLQKEWWVEHDVYMAFPEWGKFLHGIGGDYFILDEEVLDDSAAALCNELNRNPNQRERPAASGYVILKKREQ